MNDNNVNEFKYKIPGAILLIGSSDSLAKSKEKLLDQYMPENGDFLEISPDESEGKSRVIAIKQIRQAQHFINLTPHGQLKILLIEEAERMTAQAANSLLKTLEEPPRYALIALLSTTGNLLPTIISRCQTRNLWSSKEHLKSDYKFEEILKSAFYQQSQLAEKISADQSTQEFLAQFESWARQKMRHEKITLYAKLIQDIVETKRNLKHNVNARVLLENLLLKYRFG